jgi:LacI family transcriptional regulator
VGVSHVAVSHVLHRPHQARISPQTKREILRVARKMGYEPRSATTHTISLVVEAKGLWSDVTTNILTAADEILRQHDYRMTVSTLGPDNIQSARELFNQKTVDGVIFTEWYEEKSKALSALKVPWLLLADTPNLNSSVDQIALDTVQVAREMTEYLLHRGHRRICIVTGAAGIGMHERLRLGTLQALNAAGLPASNAMTIHDQESVELEHLLLTQLKKKKAPTAVIVGSPGSALVTANRLQRNGFRIPEDISLISLVDSPRLRALRPCITATDALGYQAVEIAIERLIARIKEPEIKPQCSFVSGEIIERDSVGVITSRSNS